MMNAEINKYSNKLIKSIKAISALEVENCANIMLDAYKNDRKIFICGNGGSAAIASHFGCDINKGVSFGLKKKFKIIPLTDSLATITAYANDEHYDDIFVEQLKNFYNEGDVLIGISGSGNSENILKAIEYVNQNKGISIGWTGYLGGQLKKISQNSINTGVKDMQISEDIFMIYTHMIMKAFYNKFC